MSLDVYLRGPSSGETRFTANISHSATNLAKEVGIYQAIWRPEEIGALNAGQLVPHLERGLRVLSLDPCVFRKLAPDTGATYGYFVDFVGQYLDACKDMPQAMVHACR